jgi:hypothetical protein
MRFLKRDRHGPSTIYPASLRLEDLASIQMRYIEFSGVLKLFAMRRQNILQRLFFELAFMFMATFFMTLGLAQGAERVENAIPFHTGEKLTFQARWSFIIVGEAVLEVMPSEKINGASMKHFLMTAKTNKFADVFYKVRDKIDAYTDTGMTHAVLYKNRKQGKIKRDVLVSFDWEKKEATYSNFGEKRTPISILPGSFDPLSVFYAFRLHDLKENLEIRIPVTDGKKCVTGIAKVIRREKVTLFSGTTYDTYLVEPELKHIGGVFEKSKNAKLEVWVTADEWRMPVKVKSKVIVGSFVAELVNAERTGPGSGVQN